MKNNILQEALVLLIVVLSLLRGLYQFRSFPLIGDYLSTYAALLLVYTPVIHLTFRGTGHKEVLLFFEKTLSVLKKNVAFFLLTALVIFPLFLLGNHFYQKLFFQAHFQPALAEVITGALLTQVFLVAFPEEFFFRGYLQSLLAERFPKKIGVAFLRLTQGAIFTSLLFAFAHSLITLKWWHFAIFFPSLVFAWLREKTGSVTAPILFHASSNLLIAWLGASYR